MTRPDALSEAGFPSIYRADLTLDDLARATELRPAIVSGDGHSLVVDRVLAGEVYIRDPLPVGVGEAYRISVADFLDWWSGRSVVAAP